MPVTVVIGGQYGSEGKGKVAHYLADNRNAEIAIRVGGSNSGHTVIDPGGNPRVFRHLPTASILPDVTCVLGAGTYVDVDVLLEEIRTTGLTADRLLIDPNAVVVTDRDKQTEEEADLRKSVGSTLSGTGAAVQRRISRESDDLLAKNDSRLRDYIRPVKPFLRTVLDQDKRILLEGTQGFGLSVLHADNYPYTTSRDTTAAAFVSEAGLSPLDVDNVVMVLRAFPIRVPGNSGPLPRETDWETITQESGYPHTLEEFTSVTGRKRRIAKFDPSIVKSAIAVNQPTHIVLNHLDYVDFQSRLTGSQTSKVTSFIRKVEAQINATVDYWGFGPADVKLAGIPAAASV